MQANAGQDPDDVLRETAGPQEEEEEEEKQVDVGASEEPEVAKGEEPAGADCETISADEDLDTRDARPTTRAQKYIWQKYMKAGGVPKERMGTRMPSRSAQGVCNLGERCGRAANVCGVLERDHSYCGGGRSRAAEVFCSKHHGGPGMHA